MKTWAFIQMRMNSSRLSRKPFALINGKTLTERVYEQVQKFQGLDGIAFLSTTHPADDELEEFYKTHNIPFFRGSENNIAGRFLGGANKFNADRIIRVWGDCPLIHHEVSDIMLRKHAEEYADLTSNSYPQSFPFGLNLEIYEHKTLQHIIDSTSDPYCLEFPAEFVRKDNSLKMINVEYPEDVSWINLAINYESERKFIEDIYKGLESSHPNWSLKDMISVSAL